MYNLSMTLSEELSWRGFYEQSTYKDLKEIDQGSINFYWGVDPSSDSMTIGNLATAILVMHFIKAGHKAVLLVGGATGLIGDPDGKKIERQLISEQTLESNKQAITNQYWSLFKDLPFEIVDNYDWFKDMTYLKFLRDVGKHVPMRQMMAREFIQTRLSEQGGGISYAEFSYVLIQAYDFLTLYRNKNVTLQIAGSDQWGNSIAGVELIRRIDSATANVWTSPLIVDPLTGQKFGKTEDGAIWLDPNKTSPTAFYQFWINVDDQRIEKYLKIYTFLSKEEIDKIISDHQIDQAKRMAQKTLARQVTTLVHGQSSTEEAIAVTAYLTGEKDISEASENELNTIRAEIPSAKFVQGQGLINTLVYSSLAKSNSEAKSLIDSGAIYINDKKVSNNQLDVSDFKNGRILIRRGKAFKDSALIEL